MKTIEEQGGYAYPCANEFIVEQTGMTLRDWFAGMALQGMMANSISYSNISKVAYERADAMLEARKK